MSAVQGPGAPAAGIAPADEAERLRRSARQLEGVFAEQLLKAMRETVPRDGAVDGGTGEEMFTGMLDQSLAEALPGKWGERGLGEALFRQLRSALPAATREER
ncbi:MAG TPA: rod-binding protein [Longimicrobiaceae bacterium]